MRLFVAVDIDDATRAQLARARESIEQLVRDSRVPPRITWVRPDSAHATVRFIGEVAQPHRGEIEAALSSLVVAPFDITWEQVGTFGGVHHPRVVWVAPARDDDAFRMLAKEVNARLDPVLGPDADRPLRPHVTLGRVRDPGRGTDWARVLAAVEWSPTVSRVSRVTLYQSQQSSRGPTYTALSTYG